MNIEIEDNNLPYAHWLHSIEGVGAKTIRHILGRVGTPEALYGMKREKMEGVLPPSCNKAKLADRIADSRNDFDIDKEYAALTDKKIKFTCIGHADYPYRLKDIPDSPYGIYYKGKLPGQDKPAAAIIGARNCSEYGRQMAMQFGSELAIMGVQVISGMARGIDGIGQMAALDTGGYSLGVLGCGVDICYPNENRRLYDRLCIQGGVCSEYPPGTAPKNTLFPPRNRIISGLADIVLVIESKKRSGTLITVDMALEQGKEVYALPGRASDALSEGCNRLIQQGAGLALSAQDIVKTIMESTPYTQNISRAQTALHTQNKPQMTFLTDIQTELMQTLEETPKSAEIIKEQMLSKFSRDIPLSEVLNQLMKLNLYGLVKQTGNSYFLLA